MPRILPYALAALAALVLVFAASASVDRRSEAPAATGA